MTHQLHPSTTRDLVEMLAEQGFDGMAQAMQLLINECMKLERQQFLGERPRPRAHFDGHVPRLDPSRLGHQPHEVLVDHEVLPEPVPGVAAGAGGVHPRPSVVPQERRRHR